MSILPKRPLQPLWEARLDGDRLKVTTASSTLNAVIRETPSLSLTRMLETIWTGPTKILRSPAEIDIVGHRVVHGGNKYRKSTFITAEVKDTIARLSVLAPTHNPAALRGIEIAETLLQKQPQLAVFDTAFHRDIPEAACIYPGPYEWVAQGIRRYGFHGINHQYCAERAAQILQKDVKELYLISCHLGNGCSLTAIKDGRSVDTTMGFTPLEGLMMGTRSGSVDPGILLHLLRQGYTEAELDHVLNQESGLKGISGISGDMREIEAAMTRGDKRAQLAFDIYVYRVRFYIGAMLMSLGRLDALLFTAGIGENSALLRARVCESFDFLKLKIDTRKNSKSQADMDISTLDSHIKVLVIQAQEDWAIARECWNYFEKV